MTEKTFDYVRITMRSRDADMLPEPILQWLSLYGPSRPVGGVARWGVDQYWEIPGDRLDEFRALCAKNGVGS